MRDLSLHLMDVVQNSIVAGATEIKIEYFQCSSPPTLQIEIADNGKGMSPQQVRQVTSPFYTTRTTRDIGLGIPLFQMAAQATGGTFTLTSQEGTGTFIKALFHTDHVDMCPLGDTASTLQLLVVSNPTISFSFAYHHDEDHFLFSTSQIMEILGNALPIDAPEVVEWMGAYLQENLASVQILPNLFSEHPNQ